MTRSRSATPALLCVRFLSPLGRSAARSLRQEEIGRKFGILPGEKALVARLSASATAHRLVAQESMHCSGRYSGAGVFSALPVGQQRAQVDIGQKSEILQMKHAPTAHPSASAPAQHLVSRDSIVHNSGRSHSGWSKRAAPRRARTWVQFAAFPALPCESTP